MEKIIMELQNDIEAGAETAYLLEVVSEYYYTAKCITRNDYDYLKNIIFKSSINRPVPYMVKVLDQLKEA